MKKLMMWMVWTCFALVGRAQDGGFHLVGIPSASIPVTGMKMTNIMFPVPVAAGVKVSRDVLMQQPKGVDNVIELKAIRRNFLPTNVSVYGKDGRLYSFNLHYVEDAPVLNFRVVAGSASVAADTVRAPVRLSGLPVDWMTLERDGAELAAYRGFMSSSVKSGGMSLALRGIYLRDGLLWLCFRMRNDRKIIFVPGYMRVFVEDKDRVKRTASQQVDLVPVYGGEMGEVAGGGTRSFAWGFAPLTLAKGKKLVVEVADASGGRQLELTVKGKVLLRARER